MKTKIKKTKKKPEKKDKKGGKKKSNNVQNPYLVNTAKLYALWQSIPHALHVMNEKPAGIIRIKNMGFNLDDGVFVKLLKIRTKTEFNKEFKVSMKQMKRWDDSEKIQEWIDDLSRQSNVMRFKKDVDFHFTQRTIKEGDAKRVKLWKQLYEGWRETQKIEHSGGISLTKLFEKAEEDGTK